VSIDGSKIRQGRQLSGAYDIFIGVPVQAGTSEDCLHLNIWTRADTKNAAVMVWLQPLGGSSFPLFDGASFARDGVVFVTLDYRQLTFGNFGHPALTKEAKPDQPLVRFQTMDQIAALRWIKENIEAFGGDKNNVTLFGESASAASTLQLLTIPESRGLINKAIVQSGYGWWSPFELSQMEQVGSWAAALAGLPGKDATTDQLRALPADALPQLGLFAMDGRMHKDNPTAIIAAGRMADVPLLIGWTDFDGSSLRSVKPEDYAESASETLKAVYAAERKGGADLGYQMYTDNHAGAPARWIAGRAAPGAPSYLYLFSYVRTENRGKVRGAAHGDELAFVFDAWKKLYPALQLSDEDRAATHMIRSCWISFARTGKPSCEGGPEWPRYTRDDDQLMELGVKPQVRKNFRKPQLDAQEAQMQHTMDKATKSIDELMQKLADPTFK
jgi:para-nitrobenzyl esterase